MPLLNDQIRHDVREMLADVANPVTLKVFTGTSACEYCTETRELIEEVAELSDKLSVEVYDFDNDAAAVAQYQIDKTPAVAIVGAKDYGVRLYGIPSGYEFGSLIESIKLVAGGDSGLAKASREAVARLKEPVHIQVFITPT